MRDGESFGAHVDHCLMDIARSTGGEIVVHEQCVIDTAGQSSARLRFTAGTLEHTLVLIASGESEERTVTIFSTVREDVSQSPRAR
jgi:hypothetical protein